MRFLVYVLIGIMLGLSMAAALFTFWHGSPSGAATYSGGEAMVRCCSIQFQGSSRSCYAVSFDSCDICQCTKDTIRNFP